MQPIFVNDNGPAKVQEQATVVSQKFVAPETKTAEPSTTGRTVVKQGVPFTPSIKKALIVNKSEKVVDSGTGNFNFVNIDGESQPFSNEQLVEKWRAFSVQIIERPILSSTLAAIPEIKDGYHLYLKVENSVQEEEIRQIKPELVTYLRKELRNQKIELFTVIEKAQAAPKYYGDNEKMQVLIKMNPAMLELTQKFDLGFNP